MKPFFRYQNILILLGLIAISGLFYLYVQITDTLSTSTEKLHKQVLQKAFDIQSVLQTSDGFNLFVNEAHDNEVITARLKNYLSELQQIFNLNGLAIVKLQHDSLVTMIETGSVGSVQPNPSILSFDDTNENFYLYDKGFAVISRLIPEIQDAPPYFLVIEFDPSSLEKTKMNSIIILWFILLVFVPVSLIFVYYLNRIRSQWLITAETVVIILFGLGLAYLVKGLADGQSKLQRETLFHSYVETKWSEVRSSLKQIKFEIQLLNAFFEASDYVTKDEFERFSSTIHQNNAAIKSMQIVDIQTSKIDEINEFNESITLTYRFDPKLEHGEMTFDFEQNPEIAELIKLSYLTGLRHSDVFKPKGNPTDQEVQLVYAQPVGYSIEHIPQQNSRFILVFVDLVMLLEEQFYKNDALIESLPFRFYIKDSSANDFRLLAKYPSVNTLSVNERIREKLDNPNILLSLYPLLFGGNVYYLYNQETSEFFAAFPSKGNLWFAIVSLGVLLLALSTRLFRSGWYSLEATIDRRTQQLQVRIKELELLRDLSEHFTQSKTLHQTLHWLCQRFNTNEAIKSKRSLVVTLNDQTVCQYSQADKNNLRLLTKLDIIESEKVVGALELFSEECGDQKQSSLGGGDTFLHQLQYLINNWIAFQQAGHKLNELEDRLSKLVELTFEGVYYIRNDKFEWVNQAYADMVEYPRELLISPEFNFEVLFTPKSREIYMERQAMRARGENPPGRFDFQIRTATGKVLDVELSLTHMVQNGDRIVLGIQRDVTEQRKLEHTLRENEERLQQQNEELQLINEELSTSNAQIRELNRALAEASKRAEASDKLKTAFLNNISHEVRTPLNGICGAAELLSHPEITPDEKLEMINILGQSTRRLLRTITQYMDISLLVSGNMPLIISDITFDELISPTVKSCEDDCKAKGLRFVFENQVGSLRLQTDKALFQKAIEHLLDNAVKFTDTGSVTFSATLDDGYIVLVVSDTGKGMSKQFHSRIFDLFVQEDYSDKRKYDGNGLGLPIVYRIVKMLEGSITFESEPQKGSKFVLKLPAKVSQTSEKELNAYSLAPVVLPHILVAEDEDSNYVVLKLLLERKYKARVTRAFNGQEAVDLVRQHNDIKLVVMDIKMPMMDGFEATRLIKTLRPKLPVIAVTAYALSGDEQRAIESGCDDYLPKPIQASTLFAKMAKLTQWS